MRDLKIENIAFNDSDDNEFSVKDIRPIPKYNTRLEVPIEKGMFLDEVISNQQIEGDGAEDMTFTLMDHNIEKMTENNFDINKLVNLKIPITSENV